MISIAGLRVVLWVTAALLFFPPGYAAAQGLEKALITHSSESISIAPLIYGIEKGFYRREGVELQFRILRGDLAVSAMVNSRDVDYIYGAGTAFLAAIRGAPVKILSHDFRSVLFYLMAQPNVQSPKELVGKKIAVSSLGGTGAASARASLKALGLDPDKDMTFIVIGSASIRMAAMESRSVEAAIMPVPWNIVMKQKGFKEMIYAGQVVTQPLTGIATTKEKLERNPGQAKKVLRGFLRSLKEFRRDRKGASEFIGKKYSVEPPVADEVYGVILQTLTEDGMVSQQVLQELLEQFKKETGTKKEFAISDIVDYRFLREVAREVEK